MVSKPVSKFDVEKPLSRSLNQAPIEPLSEVISDKSTRASTLYAEPVIAELPVLLLNALKFKPPSSDMKLP